MNIRRKNFVVLTAVVFGFAGVVGALLYSQMLTDRMHELELLAERTTGKVYRLAEYSSALAVTTDSVDEAAAAVEEQLHRVQSNLDELIVHPAAGHVSSALRERLNRAVTRFGPVARQLTESGRLVERMVNEPESAALFPEHVPGVSEALRRTGESDFAGSAYASGLARLETQVQRQRSALLNFISGDFYDPILDIREESQAVIDRIRLFAFSTAGAVAIALVILSWLFAHNLATRIASIEELLRVAGEGDLTVRVPQRGSDELAALAAHANELIGSFAAFIFHVREASNRVDSLKEQLSSSSSESAASAHQIAENIRSSRQRMEELDDGVERVAAAAGEITASLRELADRVNTQAEGATRTVATIESMVESVGLSTETARQRTESSHRLSRVISEGGGHVSETYEAVRQISREVDEILEIIEIINTISQQTDLLSMNAAIESAHAGDAGRGFAVVAEEIRKLAESTSANSSRIDSALKAMAERVSNAAKASEAAAAGFEEIDRETLTTAAAMREITTGMGQLDEESRAALEIAQSLQTISEKLRSDSANMRARTVSISESTSQTRDLSRQVTEAITEIDVGAQEIRESVAHTSEIAESSRSSMVELQQLVRQYRVDQEIPSAHAEKEFHVEPGISVDDRKD